eukprot:2103668-Lingulodinium_polyedra.AAC.1
MSAASSSIGSTDAARQRGHGGAPSGSVGGRAFQEGVVQPRSATRRELCVATILCSPGWARSSNMFL